MKQIAIAAALFLTMTAGIAQAQATRTWVSGVGNDADPCSFTAPCKTWAGAMSKTAAGGEIDALGSGGFGSVTINKAITLDGGEGNVSSILTGTVNGINVSAASTDRVLIRNLQIEGAGTGVIGIRIGSAKSVVIDNVTISGMGAGLGRGIDAQCSSPCDVTVKNSRIDNNSGIGMVFQGTVANVVAADVSNTSVSNNGSHGIFATNGASVVLDGVVSTENAIDGLVADGASTRVSAQQSVFTNNVSAGVQVGTGFVVSTTVGLSRCLVSGNSPGVLFSGGTVQSHQNNAIARNNIDQSGGSVTPVSTQ